VFVPWWGWIIIALSATALLAFLFRGQLRYGMRVAKALACDERLPKPLRWALRVALVIKAIPVPDLGIDEVLLAVVAVLLVTVYRPTLRAILKESRVSSVPNLGPPYDWSSGSP
jgi:hypothetical protein